MRAPPAPPATNEMNAASTSECLQMLLAASKCVSSEPENDELLERKLVETQGRKVGRSRGTPRSSVSVTPNSSGTATPTGEMDGPLTEQWLERRKKQQSMAQSRYRSRQKQKQTDLKSELDRLRALALQYQLTVVDPDAMEEEEMNGEGSPTLSDMDSSNSLSLGPTPALGVTLGTAVAPTTPAPVPIAIAPAMGDPSAPVQGLMHSWSVTSAPQLSLTPQAIAQRKYRAKLKMKRARLQRQVELYTRVLQAHMAKTGTPQPDILQQAEPQVLVQAPPQAQPQVQAFN